MRDPKRIEPLLNKLAKVWLLQPDMRFGQLMTCIFATCKCDPFVLEDDALMSALQDYLEGA